MPGLMKKSSAGNRSREYASAEAIAFSPSRSWARFFSSICTTICVSPTGASAISSLPGCTTSPASTLRPIRTPSAGARMTVCSSRAFAATRAARACVRAVSAIRKSLPAGLLLATCSRAALSWLPATSTLRFASSSAESLMNPLAFSSTLRSYCWLASLRFASACTSDSVAAGRPTSRSCRSFASACATAASACATAACSSRLSSSISTSPLCTVWPSSTGMRFTHSVSTAPTETRCGVMTRPLATTVCTSSPRTTSCTATGVPRIGLRRRYPTAATAMMSIAVRPNRCPRSRVNRAKMSARRRESEDGGIGRAVPA